MEAKITQALKRKVQSHIFVQYPRPADLNLSTSKYFRLLHGKTIDVNQQYPEDLHY